MIDGDVGPAVHNMDAEVDSAAIFDAPVGRAGRLTHARLSWSEAGVQRLALTVEIGLGHLATLEAAEVFGNRRATRTKNLRGGFDSSAPIELTLWLQGDALRDHFGGDEASKQTALLELLSALADGRAMALTAPETWVLESATQPLPGSTFAAGYRNEAAAG